MSITVLTCILGGFDNLRPPTNPDGARFVCYSDEPQYCPPWEIQPAHRSGLGAHRDSRLPKIFPHLHTESGYSIWHDGCLQMHISPREAIHTWLGDADIALFRHPCRGTVYQEASFCVQERIGEAELIAVQVERYRQAGLPEDFPLYAGGVIIRRHSPAVERFAEAWWREFRAGCSRDQIALPFALWSSGLRVATIPGNVLENDWWEFHFHGSFAHLKDNPRFDKQRAAAKARREKLEALCA